MTDQARLTAGLADRYRIERELGQGGMATVYLAHDLRHDRQVALKVLRPELAAVIGAERFLAEIKTTANLQHPHILPLFDSGRVDGSVFYVMPYVQGESLRDRLTREKQLPIDEAVQIAREVADALAAAHAAGIIHRDIKPENILLQGEHALVADFGIALAAIRADGTGRMTETGMSLGTPHYMSPEQALGERTLDARTDIYALGCVLYEMLVGEPPFTGGTAQAVLAKVMTERPTAPRVIRDTIPPGLEAATLKALAKLPADRHPTSSAFAQALTERGDSVALPGGRPVGRLVTITAAVSLVAGAVLHRAVTRTDSTSAPAAEEWRQYSIVLPDSAPLVSSLGMTSIAVSPDGRFLVYVAGTPRDDHEGRVGTRLRLLRLREGLSEELPGTQDAASPAWSPDSKEVAWLEVKTVLSSTIHRMAIDSRTSVPVLRSNGWMSGLTWGNDGYFYFAGPFDANCLSRVPASGGKVELAKGTLDASANCYGTGNRLGSTEWLSVYSGIRFGVASTTRLGQYVTLAEGTTPLMLPDGFLAFIRDGAALAARLDTRTMKLAGDSRLLLTGVRRESVYGPAHWTLAADGTLVWVAGSNGAIAQLVWADRTGRVLDTLPLEPIVVLGLDLSPDGRLVAIGYPGESGTKVRILDLTRNVVDEVPGSEGLLPHGWTDGGRALLLGPDHNANATWVTRIEAGVWVTDSTDADYVSASPDGIWRCGVRAGQLAFWRRATPDSQVSVGPGWECLFSRDGRWLAWSSNDPGIYLIPTGARSAQEKIRIAGGGFTDKRWMPDSKELYVRQYESWYSIKLPAQPGEKLQEPRLVISGGFLQAYDWSYDIGPDGRMLVIHGGPPTRATRLEVMTNFPAYVRAKLAEGNSR